MCLYVYDMFHILLSCDSQGFMECICVCTFLKYYLLSMLHYNTVILHAYVHY